MEKSRYCLFHWFLFLFLLSVSVSAFPCTVVNSLGLFGEVKASVVICEEREEAAEASVRRNQESRQVKGIRIFNIWFMLSALILYFSYVQYESGLPEKDTIVTLKVRMDN